MLVVSFDYAILGLYKMVIGRGSKVLNRSVWDYVLRPCVDPKLGYAHKTLRLVVAVKGASNHKSSFLIDFREQKLELHDMCFVS
ncbi:hypothetical protein CTI12_AA462460 [Artemisia annua]|uniref:Uncharacterized protein n=1 Tax=Artemisia annua TaxID=35608 RepID=A0A2U1LRM9_ARTAN|nr:hypothetical protein CTI12_AA462460 [Artemisia annua]